MENFSAWIKWHGPYRSKKAWEKAASDLAENDRVRLYMAIGRWKMVSAAFSRPLYVGLNSKDSNTNVADRLKKHTNPGADEHLKISGLLNEYWLGEILTRWHYDDSNHDGVTKDIETALIFSLAPIINERGVKEGPEFSFQIINEVARRSWWRRIFKSRFESLVCNFYRYDLKNGQFTLGDISMRKRKIKAIQSMTASRQDRDKPKEKYKHPFAYRVFGSETLANNPAAPDSKRAL